MSLIIDPKYFPAEGLHLEGQLPVSVIELDSDDIAQAKSPLHYELDVHRDDEGFVLSGELRATFELQCGRCAENFLSEIRITPYVQDVEIENDQPLDLTNTLREDILLALPNYPRCETSTVSPRECPAQGRFESHQEPLPDQQEPPASGGNVWEALDQFKQP